MSGRNAAGYVLFDLDSCLSDDSRRLPSVPDWDAYHADMEGDEVMNKDVWDSFRSYNRIIITARPSKYTSITNAWISKHLAKSIYTDTVLFRPEGDVRKAPEVKADLLKAVMLELRFGPEDVFAAFDDRADVLDAYRRCGVGALNLLDGLGRRPYQPQPTGAAVLRDAAETYEARNAVYGDNFRNVGAVIRAMFPDGLPEGAALRDEWHLFELVIVKLTRFANADLSHVDSIHDASVYCAMVESILKEKAQ
jgi:hypothetical protein